MSSSSPAERPLVYALVGNPNCGKTTIFNALTGLRQKVGNYPGVTVERKEGEFFTQHGDKARLLDLPGAYSLNARSPDEAVLRDVLLGRRADTPRPDRVICVVDATNLERHLYLASQVMELGLPVVLVLNMVDLAENKGLRLEPAALEETLGCPVIPMVASTKKGLVELKVALGKKQIPLPKPPPVAFPAGLRGDLEKILRQLSSKGLLRDGASLLEPLYLLSDHDQTHAGLHGAELAEIQQARKQLNQEFPSWEDDLVAARYEAIGRVASAAVHAPGGDAETLTDKLDRFFLHPFWGWVALLSILAALFYLIFSVAEGPMGWIEALFSNLSNWVKSVMAPGDLRDLITDGAIAGVQGVLVFLPQILILFFFIGLMEDTGYMARIAFIMDRLMGKVGLNGKSFLPLLSSHACAVPGVMAARTIENPKDRLITILVAPLASCSARLPVYLLLIATLAPAAEVAMGLKVGILLGMYALGIFGAFFFAWLFNKTLLKQASSPLILELPSYKAPAFKSILLHMWERSRVFVRRAGTVILGLSILLWAASTYPKSDSEDPSERLAHSVAGRMGKAIEPVIEPMGADWKIGIGLISSFAAREVFVSTMSIIYAVEEADEEEVTRQQLRDKLKAEKRADGSPIYTSALCISLMVFYVFAMQCLSTVAVVKRETNTWKWPLFQLAYMTGAAYLLSVLVYQVAK